MESAPWARPCSTSWAAAFGARAVRWCPGPGTFGAPTNTVIADYRDTTIGLNYVGDSILDSLGDIGGFVLGYTAAMSVPVWISIVGFAAVEGALLLTIRDGLLLNILMLLHPIQAVKAWQMGGQEQNSVGYLVQASTRRKVDTLDKRVWR